ncbi:hypothetical protein ACE01N_19820 [Saccharicrinis sp. FJH2]|uniref:hypothetical protein n=1 Tax=Saccharicrinis sp. FJH65 TaxID=3344659 RepID=UPI0035F48BB2
MKIIIGLLLILNVFQGKSQTFRYLHINGEVMSKNYIPLKNIKIEIADFDIITETDLNGQFNLNLPVGSVIVFKIDTIRDYFISLSDFSSCESIEQMNVSFIINSKNKEKLDKVKPRYDKVRVDSYKSLVEYSIAPYLIADFNCDIEDLTQLYIDKYLEQDIGIKFMMNGQEFFDENYYDTLSFNQNATHVMIYQFIPTERIFLFTDN